MGSRDEGDPGSRSPDEAALSARLRRLGERLDRVGPGRSPETGPRPTADSSAFARGFRLATEFVAGVILGAVLGWAVDRWLGTSPWGLIVLLLLGFAAGTLTVMRSAGVAGTAGSETKRRHD
jgi:ATP synthase protein I